MFAGTSALESGIRKWTKLYFIVYFTEIKKTTELATRDPKYVLTEIPFKTIYNNSRNGNDYDII